MYCKYISPSEPPEGAAVPLVIAFCLSLNVVQSDELNAPLFVAFAVGRLRVITGVVVGFATELLTSVPVVPKVRAATEVTVPPPPPVPPAMFTVTKSPAAETDETPEPVNRIPVAPAVT